MNKKTTERPFWKRVLIDIAGFGMLLAVPLVGWIPGPGGIPLLIGGLSLLSINHEWAARLLIEVKTKGTGLYEIIFPDKKWVYWLYDFLGLALVAGAMTLKYQTTHNLLDTLGFAIIFIGVGLLLANRKRIEKIVAFFKKKKA